MPRPPHSPSLPVRARELLQLLTAPEARRGLRVNELADLAGMPRSAVGSALSELEARGAVVHRRGVTSATATGRTLLEQVEASGQPPEGGWRAPRLGAPDPDDAALADEGRLRAVGEAAVPHRLDVIADLVRRWARTPLAFVHVVTARDAVLQGAAGLAGEIPRTLPIDDTPCREVVLRGGELVLPDALEDPRTRDYPLVRDGVARAYLGMPLVDADDQVIGVLCAMDPEARPWTPREVAAARSLAGVAEGRLRLGRVIA